MFTDKARKKLRSPDDLNEHLRVTSPRMWIVLAACASLIIGLLVWAFFGTANANVKVQGATVEDAVVCFLPMDKSSEVHVDDDANVDGKQMKVESISPEPISREEARKMLGDDYLADTLATEDWAYVVRIGGDGQSDLAKGTPLTVNITTERIAPIGLITKDAA